MYWIFLTNIESVAIRIAFFMSNDDVRKDRIRVTQKFLSPKYQEFQLKEFPEHFMYARGIGDVCLINDHHLSLLFP